MAVNIFLVEDHDIVRHGIKALLEDDSKEVQVIGEANNGAKAIELLEKLEPDVILMDLNMPVMNGLECTRFLKKQKPGLRILILSMHDHESYLIDMLDAGANGYVLKNASKDELLFAIKRVANDGMYMGPEFTMNMLAKYKSGAGFDFKQPVVDINLSEREKEVLKYISEGFTNTEMANKLFISVRTVETHRKKLLDKTGTTNVATLIKFAVENRLLG